MAGLTEKEKRILATIQYDADASITDVSNILGIPASQVRRVIQKFESSEGIKRVVYLNTASLGFHAYTYHLGVNAIDRKARNYLRNILVKEQYLEAIMELGGEYQFMLVYFARSAHSFMQFIKKLSENLPHSMAKRVFGERVYWEFSGVKHLHHQKKLAPAIRMGEFNNLEVTELDFKILRAYESPKGSSVAEVARMVGAKSSTITYRIERLKELGIIKGAVYWINPVITRVSCFRLYLIFGCLTDEVETKVLNYSRSHPNIVTCIRLLGAWDFEMRVEVPTPERVGALAEEIRNEFSGLIESVTIVPTLDHVKVQHFPL